MRRGYTRWVIFAGLAAFMPVIYYLAVVGGLLPYGAILLVGLRNLGDSSMLLFSAVHLAVYGVVLYWLSGLIMKGLLRAAGVRLNVAAWIFVLALALIGLLPIYGVAHGQIRWVNAYALYVSGGLR